MFKLATWAIGLLVATGVVAWVATPFVTGNWPLGLVMLALVGWFVVGESREIWDELGWDWWNGRSWLRRAR